MNPMILSRVVLGDRARRSKASRWEGGGGDVVLYDIVNAVRVGGTVWSGLVW